MVVGVTGWGCFAGCFMFIIFSWFGKRFLSHVPLYAFFKKRKVIFAKKIKVTESEWLLNPGTQENSAVYGRDELCRRVTLLWAGGRASPERSLKPVGFAAQTLGSKQPTAQKKPSETRFRKSIYFFLYTGGLPSMSIGSEYRSKPGSS